MLPIEPDVYGFVWSLSPAHAEQFQQSSVALIEALRDAMPDELGSIELATDPLVIPLIERWIDQPYRPGIVLIGNGAQTIHPVAGQGLNLALRGVMQITAELKQSDPDTAIRRAFANGNRIGTKHDWPPRVSRHYLIVIYYRENFDQSRYGADQSPWLKTKIAEAGIGDCFLKIAVIGAGSIGLAADFGVSESRTFSYPFGSTRIRAEGLVVGSRSACLGAGVAINAVAQRAWCVGTR